MDSGAIDWTVVVVGVALAGLMLATARMNGMLETIRAGLSYRVERADAGDRVAEDAESYEEG